MKKIIIAVSLTISLLSGCSSMSGGEKRSYTELKKEGQEILLSSNVEGYSASDIQDLEKVRIAVNSVFLIAEPIYERYTEALINTPALGNFMAATEAVDTDEEKRMVYEMLTPEDKEIVDKYLSSSVAQEAMKGLGQVVLVILKNSTLFLQVDTSSVLAQVDFTDLLAEKDRIAHTYDQIAYLDSTLVSAYENYKVVSAFSDAQ